MKTFLVHLKSASPYSASRRIDEKKEAKETHEKFEERCWREKAHWTPDGNLYIPGIQFKKALDSAAKMVGKQIPGKGKATYAKHFMAGVAVLDDTEIVLKKITRANVKPVAVWCDAQGKKGGQGGTQVKRIFPVVEEWEGNITFTIFDDTITLEIFQEHMEECGKFNGVGRWRTQNGGMYGRFQVVSCEEI